MTRGKLILKRPGSKRKKTSRKASKPRLKAYDDNAVDESGPFDDDSAENIANGVMTKDLELRDPVPRFKVGSSNDPFKGKPRVTLFDRVFAVVLHDKYNFSVYRYSSQFDKKSQDVVTKYRLLGYASSLPNAVKTIKRSFLKVGMTECQGKDIKELLKWIDKQDALLATELKGIDLHPFRSGPKPS